MRIFFLFVSLFLFVLLAPSVFASCADPVRSLTLDSDRSFETGSFDVNLSVNSGSGPLVACRCPMGEDCKWDIQYRENGASAWITVPTNTDPPKDFNCNGVSCGNFLNNTMEKIRSVTCVDQGTFEFRGYMPWNDRSTEVSTLNCYPSSNACVPPVSGDFELDEFCEYVNVPLLVDGDYRILDGGFAIHNSSDVNFTSSGTHHIRIFDGGQFDVNNSNFFIGGVSQELLLGGLVMGLFGLMLGGLFLFSKPNEVVA
jgi:hypothetical protein